MPSLITRKDTARGATLDRSRPTGTKGDTRSPLASPSHQNGASLCANRATDASFLDAFSPIITARPQKVKRFARTVRFFCPRRPACGLAVPPSETAAPSCRAPTARGRIASLTQKTAAPRSDAARRASFCKNCGTSDGGFRSTVSKTADRARRNALNGCCT